VVVHAYGEAIDVIRCRTRTFSRHRPTRCGGCVHEPRERSTGYAELGGSSTTRSLRRLVLGGRWSASPDYQHFSATAASCRRRMAAGGHFGGLGECRHIWATTSVITRTRSGCSSSADAVADARRRENCHGHAPLRPLSGHVGLFEREDVLSLVLGPYSAWWFITSVGAQARG